MPATLEESLKQYLVLIRALCAHAKSATDTPHDPRLRRSSDQQLISVVESAEAQPEFRALVDATRDEFSADPMERTVGGLWNSPAQNFFRQSRIYQGLFEGQYADDEPLIAQYREALARRKCKVTYLAPLEFVEFDQERLDFGDFQILCLCEAELDQILSKDVRKAFYPGTVVDSRQLAGYWFLIATEAAQSSPWQSLDEPISAEVRLRYSKFPAALEKILRLLVLYPFPNPVHDTPSHVGSNSPVDPWSGFFRFGIPFVIRVSDALTDSPQLAPDVSSLAAEPDVFESTDGTLVESERTPIDYSMDTNETAKFVDFVKNLKEMISEVEPSFSQWRFIDVAMNFLVKAYFSEFSDGLEQLLWHIVAVEAVLGERRSATKRLKNRASTILADGQNEASLIPKVLDHLYDLRSRLVHGSAELDAKEVYLGHLGQARDLARRVVHWMLCYLAFVSRARLGNTALPTRDELLLSLDTDKGGLARLRALFAILPSGFPRVSGWGS